METYNTNYEKNIYITYKDIHKLENIKNQWLELNPEYKIKLFDDKGCLEFLYENFGQKYCDIFNYIKDGAIKCDFFRVCIIYMYGGVYVDADIKPILPLHTYIDDCVDFATCISYNYIKNRSSYKYNPHFIVSKKYNTFLYETMKKYEKYYDEQIPYSYWDWSVCNLFNIDVDFDINLIRDNGDYIHDNKKYQFLIETIVIKDNEYDFTNIRDDKGNLIITKCELVKCKYKNVDVLLNFANKNLL